MRGGKQINVPPNGPLILLLYDLKSLLGGCSRLFNMQSVNPRNVFVTDCNNSICLSLPQVCDAYETFIFDVAKLMRAERNLDINETAIREEVSNIMQLDKDLANVSTSTLSYSCFVCVCCVRFPVVQLSVE